MALNLRSTHEKTCSRRTKEATADTSGDVHGKQPKLGGQASIWAAAAVDALADAAEEADDVGIADHLATVIPHRAHKLKEPHGCICRAKKGQQVQCLRTHNSGGAWRLRREVAGRLVPFKRVLKSHRSARSAFRKLSPTASRLFCSASILIRRPTGSSSCQSPVTPMAALYCELHKYRCSVAASRRWATCAPRHAATARPMQCEI